MMRSNLRCTTSPNKKKSSIQQLPGDPYLSEGLQWFNPTDSTRDGHVQGEDTLLKSRETTNRVGWSTLVMVGWLVGWL